MKIVKTLGKILFNLIKYAAIVFIVIFLAFVLVQRFSNNQLAVGGYRMFSVVSESMAPTYVVGDIIITKNVAYEDLKPGDDIAYQGLEGTYKGKIITHRIQEIKNENNEKLIKTKGINNAVPDPNINYSQVYGRVVFRPLLLSKINKAIQTSEGFYCLIFIPLALIIGSEILQTSLEKYKEKHNIKD